MKKIILIGYACLLWTARPSAQIDIDAISTDTVDLFSLQQQSAPKKNPLPLWSTLLLPGSGHQSIGRSKSAFGYISADVISVFCALFFSRYSKKMIDNSRSFASLHAGVFSSVDDDFFWQVVGSFNTNADYLQTMDLIRDPDKRYDEERFGWIWEDKIYREEFVSMQKVAKQLNTVSSFFIGAMILNRIIAFIDLRSDLKNNRYTENTAVRFRPFQPGGSSGGLIVSAEF